MKILSLTFSNLNSLKGTWHIDFTDDAFVSDGLFAITGQTGAGKTTILDAICLAIYGQTPRIHTISNTQNELMSVDRGDCHSEVVILLNENQGDKIYRFSFEQRRAGKKSDGKLQPIKREISLLKNLYEDGDILETKPSLCDKKAVELMHMNFEQFTRSVMLAQGNFSAFLKAEANEKGEILEQITGTHLYAKISQKTFEIHKQKKEELHQLEQKTHDIIIMDDEHFFALEKSIHDNQAKIDDNNHRLTELDAQILFCQDKTQAETEVKKYEEDLITAQEHIRTFSDTSAMLIRANKAHELSPTYHELTQKKQTLRQTDDAIDELKKQLPLLSQSMDELERQMNAQSQDLAHQKDTHQATLPLFKQVRELDNLIHHAKSHLDQLNIDINHHTNLIHANEKTITQLTKERTVLHDELATIIHKHEGMVNYPTIKQDLGILSGHHRELTSHLTQLTQHQQKLHEQNVQLEQQLTQIASKRAVLKAKKEAFNEGQNHHQSLMTSLKALLKQSLLLNEIDADRMSYYGAYFQEQIHRIHELESLIKQLEKTHQEHESIHQQISELTTRIHHTDTQKTLLQQRMDKLTDVINQDNNALAVLQKTHETQQELLILKQHYLTLTDGKPCPLCGSPSHPYATHHPFIHEADDDTKIAISHTTQQIRTHEQTLQEHKEQLANIHATLEYQKEQCQSLTLQKQQLISHLMDNHQKILHHKVMEDLPNHFTFTKTSLNMDNLSDDMGELTNSIHGYLTQLIANYDRYKDQEAAFSQSTHRLSTLKQDIDKITQEGIYLKSHIEMMTQNIAQTNLAIHDNEHAIHQLMTSINDKLASYQKPAISHQEQVSDMMAHHIHDLTQLSDQQDNYQAQKQQLESQISHLSIHLTNEQKQLDGHLTKQQHYYEQKQAVTHQYHQHQQEREQLFGDRNVDDEDTKLRQLIEQSQFMLNDIQKTYQAKQQAYLSLNEKITHHQGHAAALTLQIDELDAKFHTSLKAQSFNDVDDFLSACIDNDERMSLNQKEQSLFYKLKQAQDNLSYWQNKLNDLIKKQEVHPLKSDSLSSDELIKQKEQLKNNHQELLIAIGKQRQQFITAEENRKRHGVLMTLIDDKKQDLKIWAKLDELIGSKEGIKYRNFVQGLTLELMLHHANDVLSKMDSRYVLIHGDDKNNKSLLEISVIDTAQGSEIRSTKNLSGGESFIVSLALAMGLSQMSSENVSINSLFLDEGFGTLDDEVLDVALSVLSSLKETGKMIGIISHVHSLKERIPTQIQVKKIANGESQLLGLGVYHKLSDVLRR